MEEKRSLPEILGPILGLFLLFGAIYGVVRYYQAGVAAAQAAQRTTQTVQPAPTNAAAAPTPTMTLAGSGAAKVAVNETVATAERSDPSAANEAPTPAGPTAALVAASTADEASKTLTSSSPVTDNVTATAGAESAIVRSSITIVGAPLEIQPATGVLITGTETAMGASLPSAHEPSPLVVATVARAGCGGCHTIPGILVAVGQLGPDLTNIGALAATRKPAFSAEAYIQESILEPNAFIAPNCPLGPCLANIMPPNFGQTLNDDEVTALVAYLANLQDEP